MKLLLALSNNLASLLSLTALLHEHTTKNKSLGARFGQTKKTRSHLYKNALTFAFSTDVNFDCPFTQDVAFTLHSIIIIGCCLSNHLKLK